jgi:hypothetical protein
MNKTTPKKAGEDRSGSIILGSFLSSDLKLQVTPIKRICSVCEFEPGSGVFMTPGSGMEKNPEPECMMNIRIILLRT